MKRIQTHLGAAVPFPSAGRTVARAAAQRPGRRAHTLLSDSEEEQAGGRADSGSDSGSEVGVHSHQAAAAHIIALMPGRTFGGSQNALMHVRCWCAVSGQPRRRGQLLQRRGAGAIGRLRG